VEGEERDEELRQVAERRLHDSRCGRADAAAELVGRGAHEPCQDGDRGRRGQKRDHRVDVEVVAERRDSDQKARESDPRQVTTTHTGSRAYCRLLPSIRCLPFLTTEPPPSTGSPIVRAELR
jgi:hypothetical protein